MDGWMVVLVKVTSESSQVHTSGQKLSSINEKVKVSKLKEDQRFKINAKDYCKIKYCRKKNQLLFGVHSHPISN